MDTTSARELTLVCNRQKQPTRPAIKMVAANRKVKKVQAADFGLAKNVAIQPIQSNDPKLMTGLGKIQDNASVVLDQVALLAATLKHSDPISNTDVSDPLSSQKGFSLLPRRCPNSTHPAPSPWARCTQHFLVNPHDENSMLIAVISRSSQWNAVAAEVGQDGETAEDAEQAFKLLSIQLDFEKGDDVDEPCVPGPSRAPGSGSVQNKAANTTTPNKRAGPAPKKSAVGVKKATGKTGAKAACASKGKGKAKAIVEDSSADDAMDIDEYEYEAAQPKAMAKGKGKQKAVVPREYSDVSDEWIEGM
jgi:hypothetical protein